MPLSDGVAIVTGGGRGIGRVMVLRLAQAGARVVLAGRMAAELEDTRKAVQDLGGVAVPVVTDVSNEEQVTRMVRTAQEAFGRIDLLVNNAGIMGPTRPVAEMPRADWDAVLSVNLTGAFLCAREVLPAMRAQRAGKIINISSVAGKLPYPLRSPYAASKWGLIGFTKTLAKEVGAYNIQVNAICPGPVEGENMQRVIQNRAAQLNISPEAMAQEFIQKTALGRMVPPSEVADLVLFLASEAGNNITGQAIDIDAGFTLS